MNLGAIDLRALVEAASRPDHPLGQLVGALLARSQGADPDPEPSPIDSRALLLERRCRLLAARNRMLAEAFGACRCWGGDPTCRRCGGDGAPGWEAPRTDWLADLLMPLLERRPDVLRRWLDVPDDSITH